LPRRLLPRVARGKKELGDPEVRGAFERVAVVQALATQCEEGLDESGIVRDTANRRPHLIHHLRSPHPAVEPIQLKVDTDVGMKRMESDRQWFSAASGDEVIGHSGSELC
jgi:hypothetical protein